MSLYHLLLRTWSFMQILYSVKTSLFLHMVPYYTMYALQWWPSWISNNGYFVDRGLPNKNSSHVCFQMVKWFQRISLKYFPHRVLCKFWENTIIISRVIPLWLRTLKFLSLLLKSSSVNFVISDKKNICVKLCPVVVAILDFSCTHKKFIILI